MASAYRHRALIIVPAEDRDAANHAAREFDSDGETFTVGLSPDGEGQATHYWCSAAVTAEQWRQLILMRAVHFPRARVVEWYEDAEPMRPARLLDELGLKVIESPVYVVRSGE